MAKLDGVSQGRGQKGDQFPGGGMLIRCRAYCSREDSNDLNPGRQRADDIDARQVHQLAQLLETQLDFPARDEHANRNAGRCLHDARGDGFSDAPALKQATQVRAARTRRIADAACGQNGVANGRLSADFGSRRPGCHRNRHA